MNIGASIKYIRKFKGFKQSEITKKTNLSQGYLSRIENNKQFPNNTTLLAICKALDVSVANLLLHSLDDIDVKPEKLQEFKVIKPILRDLLMKIV